MFIYSRVLFLIQEPMHLFMMGSDSWDTLYIHEILSHTLVSLRTNVILVLRATKVCESILFRLIYNMKRMLQRMFQYMYSRFPFTLTLLTRSSCIRLTFVMWRVTAVGEWLGGGGYRTRRGRNLAATLLELGNCYLITALHHFVS